MFLRYLIVTEKPIAGHEANTSVFFYCDTTKISTRTEIKNITRI